MSRDPPTAQVPAVPSPTVASDTRTVIEGPARELGFSLERKATTMGDTSSAMSPADFMALTNNNGLGGDNTILLFFLFMLIYGNGAFGGANGGYATNTSVQQGFDMQNTLANQRELLAATNQTYHDIMAGVQNVYTETQRDIAGLAVGQANILAQQNQCCGELSAGLAQNRFDAAMNTSAIVQAVQAEGNATRSMIQQDKIEALQNQVNQLQLQNAVAGVVRYPMASTYTSGANPFCGCGCGFNM